MSAHGTFVTETDLEDADVALAAFREAQGDKNWMPKARLCDPELRRRVARMIELVRIIYARFGNPDPAYPRRDLDQGDKLLARAIEFLTSDALRNRLRAADPSPLAYCVPTPEELCGPSSACARAIASLEEVRRFLGYASETPAPNNGRRDEALRTAVRHIRESAAGLVGRKGSKEPLSVGNPAGPGCEFVVAVLKAAGVDASHSTISKL